MMMFIELKDNVSTNQFLINAIAEKLATLKTLNHLEKRVLRGSKAHALDILANAPSVEPDERDKINE